MRTLAWRSCTAAPVWTSNIHPCHGPTILLPSIIPCPRGPPRCKQTLSIAEISPFTLATQTTRSFTVISAASPSAGSSDAEQRRVNGINIERDLKLQSRNGLEGCQQGDGVGYTSRKTATPRLPRVTGRLGSERTVRETPPLHSRCVLSVIACPQQTSGLPVVRQLFRPHWTLIIAGFPNKQPPPPMTRKSIGPQYGPPCPVMTPAWRTLAETWKTRLVATISPGWSSTIQRKCRGITFGSIAMSVLVD